MHHVQENVTMNSAKKELTQAKRGTSHALGVIPFLASCRQNLPGARGVCGVVALLCVLSLSGCHWDMWDNGRLKPYERSTFPAFTGSSAQNIVAGTVSYNSGRIDEHLNSGKVNGELINDFPEGIELSRELLERGQTRFNIYCSPCHGLTGHGDGMIVQRGFPPPPSYHEDPRLLEAPLGYFVDVMTNGFGRMYSYASRISPEDRWAVAAYLRTLQLSQHAAPQLLPGDILELARQGGPEEEPEPATEEHGNEH